MQRYAENQAKQVASILRENGCMQCHSATAATPFYGNLPLIGPTVKADMREGTRYLDLTAMLEALDNGKLVSEADLAKVEDAALSGSMPPAKYSHMPSDTACIRSHEGWKLPVLPDCPHTSCIRRNHTKAEPEPMKAALKVMPSSYKE